MVWQSEQGPLTIAITGAVTASQKEMPTIKIILYFTIDPQGNVQKRAKRLAGHFIELGHIPNYGAPKAANKALLQPPEKQFSINSSSYII